MKRLLLALVIGFFPLSASAQEFGWCGYALIEGLPLLDNQIAVLAAITPPKSARVNPADLFQYRFSLDHTKVIVEGCFRAFPSYELVTTLLSQSVSIDARYADPALVAKLSDQGVNVADPVALSSGYIADKLTYSIFAPGGTRDESAAAARDYLASNNKLWETPEE